jgi:hypothetical protein
MSENNETNEQQNSRILTSTKPPDQPDPELDEGTIYRSDEQFKRLRVRFDEAFTEAALGGNRNPSQRERDAAAKELELVLHEAYWVIYLTVDPGFLGAAFGCVYRRRQDRVQAGRKAAKQHYMEPLELEKRRCGAPPVFVGSLLSVANWVRWYFGPENCNIFRWRYKRDQTATVEEVAARTVNLLRCSKNVAAEAAELVCKDPYA